LIELRSEKSDLPESSFKHAAFTTTSGDVEVSGTNNNRLRVAELSESFLSETCFRGKEKERATQVS